MNIQLNFHMKKICGLAYPLSNPVFAKKSVNLITILFFQIDSGFFEKWDPYSNKMDHANVIHCTVQ